MGIFDNIKQNKKQKQDIKIIEKIKHSNSPKEIYGLIEQLQLDDSRMQVFKLFDDSHVFDSFKEKKYDEIGSIIQNPYIIFEQLQEDKNKLEIIQYFYEHGINEQGFNTCIGETKDNSNIILLKSMESQEYREQVLDTMYNSINLDSQSIEELVLGIIDNMNPEKRKQFLQSHSFNNRMTILLYNKYNNEALMQKSNSSMDEYLSATESIPVISGINQEQAKKILELYGETMCSTNLEICVECSSNNVESLENNLNKYYARLKSKISSIFKSTTLWSYDYKKIEMFIRDFSNDIDENTVKEILDNYNESLSEAEDIMKKKPESQDKIKDFVEHDKEEPQFLYETVCRYYDSKMQDETFQPTLINEIITNLPFIDRLDFVKKYKDRITALETDGIGKEVIAHADSLDIKNFLLKYQDVISSQDIIDIINSAPFKQRIELIKLSNLDEEQKKEIIKYAQENGEQNVSFLELAATKAELEKMNENIQIPSEHNTNEFTRDDKDVIDK